MKRNIKYILVGVLLFPLHFSHANARDLVAAGGNSFNSNPPTFTNNVRANIANTANGSFNAGDVANHLPSLKIPLNVDAIKNVNFNPIDRLAAPIVDNGAIVSTINDNNTSMANAQNNPDSQGTAAKQAANNNVANLSPASGGSCNAIMDGMVTICE